jgi:hypothetical protein
MNTPNIENLIIRDSGVAMRVVGALFAIGSIPFFLAKMQLPGAAFIIAGLVLILISSDLTIIADVSTRTLRLEYRYLLFHTVRKIPFDDIDNIRSVYHHSSSNGHSSSGYRLVATVKDGKTIPFRLTYSGGTEITHQATQLRSFIRDGKIIKTPVRRSKAKPEITETVSSDHPDETNGTGAVPSFEKTEPGATSENHQLT